MKVYNISFYIRSITQIQLVTSFTSLIFIYLKAEVLKDSHICVLQKYSTKKQQPPSYFRRARLSAAVGTPCSVLS